MSKVLFSKWHQESIKKMFCASYEPMGVALVEPARDWLILVFGQAVTSSKYSLLQSPATTQIAKTSKT
ncbi:hypothetical protein F2Q69_00060373 [Brassica cretica]|uniref:Uncharacterized protein n=1 Tax=Brassica cretica TaxID=69181 RepID=A0A8S9RIS4_BRACR|nr:hypothetical protein F2Q69_00060373 [Brassica cretica]